MPKTKFSRPVRSDESSCSDSDDTFTGGDGSEIEESEDEWSPGVVEEEDEDGMADDNDYLSEDDDSSIMTETVTATAPTKKRPKIAKVSFSPEKLPPSTPKKGSHHTVDEKCLSNQLSSGLELNDGTDLGEGMGVHVKSTGMGNFEYDGDDDSGGGYDSDGDGGGKPHAREGGVCEEGVRGKGSAGAGRDNSDSSDDEDVEDGEYDDDGGGKPRARKDGGRGRERRKQWGKKELSSQAKIDFDLYIHSMIFSGGRNGLDEEKLTEICIKHDLDIRQCVNIIGLSIKQRQHFELRYQEQGNPKGYQYGNKTSRFEEFSSAFQNAIPQWDGKTPDSILEAYYKQATGKIKKNDKDGPICLDFKLGERRSFKENAKVKSEAMTEAYAKGHIPSAEGFGEGNAEVAHEVFGHALVNVFKIIVGQTALDDVEVNFNVNHSNQSLYHGWTITSGAENLATEIVKEYKVIGNNVWAYFLYLMRKFGVKEDVCNYQGRYGNCNLNKRKFIFYYPHMHSRGLSELKSARYLKSKVFGDKDEEE